VMLTPTSDPIAILLAEHEAAYRLFDRQDEVLTAFTPDSMETVSRVLEHTRALLTFLERDLELHIRKEEEPLFPRVKAALPADDRLIDEMVAEHDQIRLKGDDFRVALQEVLSPDDHAAVREQRAELAAALARVEAGAIDTAHLTALRRAWRTLAETMRVHFQNEEEIVFPLATELLSADMLAEAGREMIAMDLETHEQHPAPVRLTDPRAVLPDLLASPEVQRTGRTAHTLLKEGPLRVVLVALRSGGDIQEHTAGGPVTIQALTGAVTVTAAGASHDLAAGDILALPAGLPHAVRAREASGLLLTVVLAG